MKYCPNCGAQLPDEAKFCKECGTKIQPAVSARTSDDGKGIVIDAPEGATVEIEDEEEQGLFRRLVGYIMLYGKVIAIAVGFILLAVVVKGFFSDKKSEERETTQTEQVTTSDRGVSPEEKELGELENVLLPKVGDAQNEAQGSSGIQIIEPAQGYTDVEDLEDGFQRYDDMTLQERTEYLEALLERTEKVLQEEEAKGSAADPDRLKILREGAQNIRKILSGMQ